MIVDEPGPNPPPRGWRTDMAAAGRALRGRDFRLYFLGQLISLVGTWMQSLAQGWLVYRLSGSAFDLGLVAFVSQAPVFLFTFYAGVLADRVDKRRLVIATQTTAALQAAALAALTISGQVTVNQVLILAFALGLANAFETPARQALLIDMVGRADLPNAIALNSLMFNVGRLVGPALGGLLVATLGEGGCFALNAASYLAVIASLLAIKVRSVPRMGQGSAGRAMTEGLRFAWTTRPFAALYLNLVAISVLGLSYMTLMPILVGDTLKLGPDALGVVMAAAGLGALIASLRLAGRSDPRGLETWPTRYAVGLGVMLALFAQSRQLWLSALCLVPVGFCFLSAVVATNTLLQSLVPDRLRGRIMSFHVFCLLGVAPFGAFAFGATAHAIGAPWTITLGGLSLALVALVLDRAGIIAAHPPGLAQGAPKA